ncbi:MAG: hypothetical protein ACLTLQ_05040 [[Clostridium] scindens]
MELELDQKAPGDGTEVCIFSTDKAYEDFTYARTAIKYGVVWSYVIKSTLDESLHFAQASEEIVIRGYQRTE